MSLWADNTINAAAEEAEITIADEIKCINKRVSLNILAHISLYVMPDDLITIRRVTWLGKKLEPLAFQGILKYPVVNPGLTGSTPESGTPYAYLYSGFGENYIKLFPTPSAALAQQTTNLYGSNIALCALIEYFALPDITGNTYRLPQYIARRIIKSFTLARLLAMEGPGQDLIGAKRHRMRYENLLADFRSINSGVFVSRNRTRSPNQNSMATRISRPSLPSNYGSVVDD